MPMPIFMILLVKPSLGQAQDPIVFVMKPKYRVTENKMFMQ